ncbi:uncharacterized protein LOC123721083 [Papilio machaon]|uniref:uncharacterized protein LOC123721083 n=1 Tax=Papilio machaon TaxID=76193 RepID=UPI001E66536E|nr:uncharacterized protein LOC123721083 [Papilio machaon]
MKPPSDTFICPRKSISFCPRKLDSNTQIKTIYPQQFKIYNVCSPVLQPKEIKLLQKLLKSRAVYDDTRNQVCESLTSINGKCVKNLSPCEAQKIKAIVQFINNVDKGSAMLPIKDRKQTCCNEKTSCTRPCSRERSVRSQEPCAEVTPEKPRKQTNVFIKRVVKKCCNRTTCVQVQAIESIDDDSRSAKGKSSCDTKDIMKCFPLEKDLLNSLPKECRNFVKSCTKLDCTKGNDLKMPYIARCCIKKKLCDEKPLVQVKSSKNIGCQKEITCRKASQAKISLFKKGTHTDPFPKGGCCAKVKAKLKPKPCMSTRSLNSIINSTEKICGKQCPRKAILKKCDVCKCNKKTQTKKVAKKDVKQNAKGKNAKKNASCIKLNVEDNKKDNTSAIVCVKMFKDERNPNCSPPKSETFRLDTYLDKSRPACPTAVYKCRKNNTKPKCRSQSCNTLEENQYTCVPTKMKKHKKGKCPGEKCGTCPGKHKHECPAKEKCEKRCCTAKKHETCPAKPPKCQVVRIGSNFSFHIEFYKNRTKERRPTKCNKKSCKNKGSFTKCEPPLCKAHKFKSVATTTKPMCCSVCYCIKKNPQKSKPKPPKPAAPSFNPTSCSVCYCIKPGKRKPKSSCLKPTCCSVTAYKPSLATSESA